MKIYLLISYLILSFTAFGNNHYIPGFPDYKPIVDVEEKKPTENIYPNINSSGFIEMKVSGRDYTDDLNKLETIRNDEYYKKIPNDILKGSLKLENRYDIQLDGQLDEETEVRYSIQKEPDFPGVYNVYIRKNTSELQFGDFNTEYKSGEYINIEKYLNGVEINTIQDMWKAKATLGKEKSEPQKFETYGTGTKLYKVGKTFLLQGSVIVYVNNKELSENKDYTVNYFDGSIQFNQILTKIDYIKVIYEFTNPIQDFVPSLSRKNFTAINYSYSPSQNIVIDELSVITKNETIIINNEEQVLENRIILNKSPIKLGSEIIYLNDKLLTKGVHYYLKNNSGLLRFTQKQLNFNDKITAEYQYYNTKSEQELIFGNGSPGPYYLKQKYPLKDSIKVTLGNIEAREFIDYIYNSQSNSIDFYYSIYRNKAIQINYDYKLFDEKELSSSDANLSVSITHLDESTSVRDNLSNYREDFAPSEVDNNVIKLQDAPIDKTKDSFISVTIDDTEIDASEYTINYYTGEITLTNYSSSFTVNDVKLSYYYLTSLYTEYSIKGHGDATYKNTDHINLRPVPVKYNGVDKITIYLGSTGEEIILEEDQEYTINYENDGEDFLDLSITFIITGTSRLTKYPNTNDQIKFNYYYTPSPGDTEADSTHSLTDVRIQQKISDNWKIVSEIANTKYNYSKTSEQNKEVFTTQQEDNKYILESSPLVQNSELVFINGFPQTRDNDYYINYEEGEITFINKTIPDGTTIEILYDYYLSDTPNKNDVNAYSITSEFKPIETVVINNKINVVDPNFLPIGNINISKGTSRFTNSVNWNISQNETLSFLHENEYIQNNQYEELLKKDVLQTDLIINIQQFETSHQIRYEDTSATENYTQSSKKIVNYDNTLSLNINDDKLSLINNISQKNEKISSTTKLNSLIGGTKFEYINNFKINNLIESGDIIPYAGITIDKTNSNDLNNYHKKIIESYGATSKTSFNQYFNSTNSFDKSIYKTYYINETSYIDPYYNYSSLSNFNPFHWISTNANISHEESISPIPGQENKVENRKGINITRLANDAGLEYLKFPKLFQNSFRGSYTTFGYLNTNRRTNAALNRFYENRFYGTLNAWKPFEGFKVQKFKGDANTSKTEDNEVTSYQNNSSSKTTYYSVETGFNYKPNATILNKLLFDGNIKYSNSDTISNLALVSGTTNITETIKITNNQSYGVNIMLPEFPIFITKFKNPTLRLERKWNIETDKNITNSTDSSLDSTIIENSSVSANVFSLDYSLFKSMRLKNTALDEKAYYNRNRTEASTGSLFKKKRNLDQEITSTIFNNFTNTEYFKFERLDQFKNTTINVTSNDILSNYNTYLRLDERLASHETRFKLSKLFSITGKVEFQDFTQEVASKNSDTTSSYFNQNTGTSGLTLTPLDGLSIDYKYSIKQLKTNNNNSKNGNKDIFNIRYNPLKYDNFEMQINISREKNWGFGFNTIEKDLLLQTTSETLSLSVIDRNDITYLGSINLNIILPINNSEHLEKIIFTTEGYFKKIIDHINSENSIMINGLIFNVRMEL